jgi:hypothetical protein
MTVFYSLKFEITPIWKARFLYLFSPKEQDSPVIPPGTGYTGIALPYFTYPHTHDPLNSHLHEDQAYADLPDASLYRPAFYLFPEH